MIRRGMIQAAKIKPDKLLPGGVNLPQLRNRMPRRGVLAAMALMVWIAAFFGGALPAWKNARRNEVRIAAMSARLVALNQWSVAGVWLGEEIRQWEPVQRETYDRLFPAEKAREDLFLELVRVANTCGIDPIRIMEAPHAYRPGTEDWDEGYYYDEEAENIDTVINELINEFAPDLSGLPNEKLVAHRALVDFAADYDELAKFLESLEFISRALSLHRLTAAPLEDGVEVRLELDFYVQKQD